MRFFLLIIISTVFSVTSAQDAQADMMKAWQEYMTPGPMHEFLAKTIGTWKTELTTWMDPSQPPVKSEGKAVCETILGGRFVQYKHTGEVMGMPMEGIETTGYDNAKKKFVSSWMDNMSTGIMHSEGTFDESSKTLTSIGIAADPLTGKEVKIKQVTRYPDNDNIYVEMFDSRDGKEVKTMEIRFIRAR